MLIKIKRKDRMHYQNPITLRMRPSPRTSSQVLKRGIPTDHWRAVVDNFMIEFLAALFINMSAVMYGGMKAHAHDPLFSDPWTQFIAALVMGLVMMSLKVCILDHATQCP